MRRPFAVTAMAMCIGLWAGCTRTVVQTPLNTGYDPNDTTAQLDFWHGLPGQHAVSNDEALHGVLLMFDGSDTSLTYENRVAALKERGWLGKGFDEAADLAMQRGTLAYILVRAMNVRGGVMMMVTSRHARYANLELQRLGIMPPGSEMMVLDGLDYVGTMSKAQDYMVVKGLKDSTGADPADPSSASENAEPPPAPQGNPQPS